MSFSSCFILARFSSFSWASLHTSSDFVEVAIASSSAFLAIRRSTSACMASALLIHASAFFSSSRMAENWVGSGLPPLVASSTAFCWRVWISSDFGTIRPLMVSRLPFAMMSAPSLNLSYEPTPNTWSMFWRDWISLYPSSIFMPVPTAPSISPLTCFKPDLTAAFSLSSKL